MKRVLAILSVMVLLCVPVSAQSSLDYVTDFGYARIQSGGIDGAFVFGAYENDGQVYKMGLLTEEGEQTRTTWTVQGWKELFSPVEWSVTVHKDAGEYCPYASSHKDTTLCPYRNVSLVTLTNTQTGVALENYYMQNVKKHVNTTGTIHMCFGNYEYTSPETLKWDGESPRMALRDEQGRWGVYDAQTDAMMTPYAYSDMSTVYGDYVKVSDGAAWGRLDLSGATPTVYTYPAADAFSVTEELRETASGQWQVFNADNEPISARYEGTAQTLSYTPDTHLVMKTDATGNITLLDLNGATAATFDSTYKVLYLDRACYAVERYNDRGSVIGVALAMAADVPQPEDTVLMGDVNFDDNRNSSDVRLLLRGVMRVVSFTERQMLAADMNGDGIVDSADARILMTSMV